MMRGSGRVLEPGRVKKSGMGQESESVKGQLYRGSTGAWQGTGVCEA